MTDRALLAMIAAIAFAFEVQAVQNLAPVVWPAPATQVGALCFGLDLNAGCPFSDPLPEALLSP